MSTERLAEVHRIHGDVPAKTYLELRRQVAILALVLVVASPIAAITAWWTNIAIMRQVRIHAWCVAAVGGGLTVASIGLQVLAGRTRWQWCGLAEVIMGYWWLDLITGIPLGILAGGLLAMAMHQLVRGMEWHPVERRRFAVHSHRDNVRTAQLVTTAPEHALGVWIGGDLPEWKTDKYCVPPMRKTAAMALVGESGSGKTVTAMGLARIWALEGRQVVLGDFKGSDPELAPNVVGAYLSAKPDARVVVWPAQPLDIWRGSDTEIVSKLIGVHQFSDTFWKQVAETAVRLVMGMPHHLPCRSSQEFLRRMNPDLLLKAYEGSPQLQDVFAIASRPDTLNGARLRFSGFFAALNGRFDGDTALEDADLVMLTVPALAVQANADAIARILVSEYGSYCVSRKPRSRKSILMIDEFSAVGESAAGQVVSLAERVRDANGMIVIAAQDAEGLGRTPSERNRMRNACTAGGLIVHRMADPEPLLEGAGTMRIPEQHWQQTGEDERKGEVSRKRISGTGMVKMTDRMKIRPDDIRSAPTGRAWVINRGRVAEIQVIPPKVPMADLARGREIVASAQAAAVQLTPKNPLDGVDIPVPALPLPVMPPMAEFVPGAPPLLNAEPPLVNTGSTVGATTNGNGHHNGNGHNMPIKEEQPWD